MGRYRNYPKYKPKISISDKWAKKLKKLSAQKLTLHINKISEFQESWEDIIQRYKLERGIILDAISAVDLFKIEREKNLKDGSFIRKYVYDSGNSANDEKLIYQSLSKDKVVNTKIKKALKSVIKKNSLVAETNLLIKKVNKFFSDSGWQSDLFPIIDQTKEDFFAGNVDDTFLFAPLNSNFPGPLGNEMKLKLMEAKSSFYEIRKQINKKEKSAKLASYEDKSRNIGQSLMSSMKAKVKSPFNCPYCKKRTPKNKIHIDHINPVSNGGLSVERNLVAVCSKCNLDKSNLSLRAFSKKNKLDYDSICDSLEEMGKFV